MMPISLLTTVLLCAAGPDDLRARGAFAFPQDQAAVLCDTPDLRLSVWNDAEYLYAQAVLWRDGDKSLGVTDDGRDIGDQSNLMLDLDGDGRETNEVDREYTLDPWPFMTGLHYQTSLGEGASTGLTGDSRGHGCIRYVDGPGGPFRVDSFVIPLAEIGKKPGQTVRLAYWADSPHPKMIANSVGFKTDRKEYYSHHIPHSMYHEVTLVDRAASLDISQVPEGRAEIVIEAAKPMPPVGSPPPEFNADRWINWPGNEPPSLSLLKGKVIVVEFWATWCGPCVESIPHLAALHQKHSEDGMVLLALTDQPPEPVEKFLKTRAMPYAIGTGSKTHEAYGVRGIPHAFIIGRDGNVLWTGSPFDPAFDARIEESLKGK
ncbi:MAG: TlpA family protein disulfide reductase [Phycisphaerales bacterium]|nr:TlpA family protein disulfide reductase [Phycisphaerales bacterium]